MSPRIAIRYWLGLIAVGVTAGAFALGFRMALFAVVHVVYRAPDLVTAFEQFSLPMRVLVPVIGALGAGTLVVAARHRPRVTKPGIGNSVGVGATLVVIAGAGPRPGFVASLVRAIASWCAVVAGLSLGRESAILQFGGSSGGAWAARLAMPASSVRIFVAAGLAAGFATAYAAPLAAIAFVIEVSAVPMSALALGGIAVAVGAAMLLADALAAGGAFYSMAAIHFGSAHDVAVAVVIAFVVGAVMGCTTPLLSLLLAAGRKLLHGHGHGQRSSLSIYARAVAGAIGCAAVLVVVPAVAGNGYEPIVRLLVEHPVASTSLASLAILAIAKWTATSLSIGGGNPGGIFTPTLLVGACTGAMLWFALRAISPDAALANHSIIIVLGMASAIAATCWAPITATLLIVDFTGNSQLALPALVASLAAMAFARLCKRRSVFSEETSGEQKIETGKQRGKPVA